MIGEAVAGSPHQVNVARAVGDALIQGLQPLVDQRVQKTFGDLLLAGQPVAWRWQSPQGTRLHPGEIVAVALPEIIDDVPAYEALVVGVLDTDVLHLVQTAGARGRERALAHGVVGEKLTFSSVSLATLTSKTRSDLQLPVMMLSTPDTLILAT